MRSCLYEGTVRHRRRKPVANSFTYSVFMAFVDLGELDRTFRVHPLWSGRRPNLAYLRRADHFGDPAVDLETTVRDLVEKRTGHRPAGPVCLLTHLRYFGHCMNPVSFYYCYGRTGNTVETIVAEVHNTPWGERHCYVLDVAESEHPEAERQSMRFRFRKDFHVSPFMGMDQLYDWRFALPGSSLAVHMENWEKGTQILDATLLLRRREMTHWRLSYVLLRFPLMTVKVVTAIYWQAVRLWIKRCPFYPHPRKRKLETA